MAMKSPPFKPIGGGFKFNPKTKIKGGLVER